MINNNRLEAEIKELEKQSITYLRDLWESYFEDTAPQYNRQTIINKLAYRMQELAYGGLSTETKNIIKELKKPKKQKRVTAFRPAAGTRLMRDYKGEPHHVTVLVDGYEYQGKRYRSLSAIATLIAGTRWSGNTFFGLKLQKAYKL